MIILLLWMQVHQISPTHLSKSSSVKLEAINFYGEGGVNELEKVDILKLLKADILKLC